MVGQGEDVSNILIDQHRLLTKTVVNFTPPSLLNAGGGAHGQDRKRGEDAVQRDLYALISEARPQLLDRIGSQFGLRNIDTYITTRNKEKIHLLWENIDPSGSRLKELHNRYRNPRTGRPWRQAPSAKGEWKSRIVVTAGTRAAYVKEAQSHVGRWKAKWALAAVRLGWDKCPGWISRHFGQDGAVFSADLKNPGEPFILFGCIGPNARKNIDSIKAAVQTRTKAMALRAQLVCSAYAKDVAAGMKPKPHAKEFADETEGEEVS